MILVAIILVDSLRIWTGIFAGSRSSQVVEAPFVVSRLRTEEA
jgi:carbon starvation protein